ncbi:MAG: acyltransferase family protein [Muribaculaceae bacterium]|nr:acyltransferase family protein [Muribaculaceae bacterium]
MSIEMICRRLQAEKPEVVIPKGKRIQNLDALKLLSLMLVLCLHCSHCFYSLAGVESLWSVTRFIYCMGVLAIPMFFIVSGYQLLGRENSGYGYSVRKIYRILRTSFLLYLLVLGMKWAVFGEMFTIAGIPRQFCLNLFQRGDYGLLWFVGALCLVYLAYPAINRLYIERKKLFLWLAAGLMAVMSFAFMITVVRPSDIWLRETGLSQTLRLWIWLGYFCMGGLIKRYKVFDELGRVPVVLVLAAVSFIFLNMIASRRGIWFCEYGYSSIVIVAFVVSVFTWFMKFKIDSRFIKGIIVAFMPAYVFGPVFQDLIADKMILLPEPIGAAVFVLSNGALALCAGWLLMKIPGVSRLLKL